MGATFFQLQIDSVLIIINIIISLVYYTAETHRLCVLCICEEASHSLERVGSNKDEADIEKPNATAFYLLLVFIVQYFVLCSRQIDRLVVYCIQARQRKPCECGSKEHFLLQFTSGSPRSAAWAWLAVVIFLAGFCT